MNTIAYLAAIITLFFGLDILGIPIKSRLLITAVAAVILYFSQALQQL